MNRFTAWLLVAAVISNSCTLWYCSGLHETDAHGSSSHNRVSEQWTNRTRYWLYYLAGSHTQTFQRRSPPAFTVDAVSVNAAAILPNDVTNTTIYDNCWHLCSGSQPRRPAPVLRRRNRPERIERGDHGLRSVRLGITIADDNHSHFAFECTFVTLIVLAFTPQVDFRNCVLNS